MNEVLSKFYLNVATRTPLRNRVLGACLGVEVLSVAAALWLAGSQSPLNGESGLIMLIGCVLLPTCGLAWFWCSGERIRVGQVVLAHGGRGVVELELGPGSTLRRDARRIARLTRNIDEETWADLKLFVRTSVWTEDRLASLGFETRRSGVLMSLAGYCSYTVKWIWWTLTQAMKGRKPPKFVQRGRYIEGETDLGSYVRRWSGPERRLRAIG